MVVLDAGDSLSKLVKLHRVGLVINLCYKECHSYVSAIVRQHVPSLKNGILCGRMRFDLCVILM